MRLELKRESRPCQPNVEVGTISAVSRVIASPKAAPVIGRIADIAAAPAVLLGKYDGIRLAALSEKTYE
jgi:hypothetical protein